LEYADEVTLLARIRGPQRTVKSCRKRGVQMERKENFKTIARNKKPTMIIL
jgi:hypothetical protein